MLWLACWCWTLSTRVSRSIIASYLAVAVNDAPMCTAKAYATQEDTPLTKDAANGVLAGASDPDGDPLSAKVSQGPAHGSLSLEADGSFTYTPAPDFNGADGFEFLGSDSAGGQALTKASITVGEWCGLGGPLATQLGWAIGSAAWMAQELETQAVATHARYAGGLARHTPLCLSREQPCALGCI